MSHSTEAFDDDTNKNAVLVYGSNGFLGSELIEELKRQNKPYKIGLARLENRQDIIDEVKLVKPSRILCMAGLTGKPNISWFENNQVEGLRINVLAQLNVADVAKDFNLHCTLLTTGVIYKYDENHPINSGIGFKEDEEPNYSANFYSYARILEEKLLKSYTNVLNLRISYPTTGNLRSNSFFSKLITFQKIQSIPLSVTIVDDLWPILVDMSGKKITGTFNFNNEGSISHNEVLEMYKELSKPNHTWESAPVDLSVRSACELDVQKLKDLGYNIPNVKESFKRIILKHKEEYDKMYNFPRVEVCEIYSNTVLVTGGAGYLGSRCLSELVKVGFKFIVVDNFNSSSETNLKNVEQKLNKKIQFFNLDITNKNLLSCLFNKHRFHSVLHLASSKRSDSAIEFYKNTVQGTLNLLECMKETNVKNFVYSSSISVYGDSSNSPVVENQELSLKNLAHNQYAKGKHMVEEILNDFKVSNEDWNIVILRHSNHTNHGEHSLAQNLARTALGKQEQVNLNGNENDLYYLTHVEDIANAFAQAVYHFNERLGFKVYNIGNSVGYKLSELINTLENLTGKKINYKLDSQDGLKISSIAVDSSFAEKELNWKISKNLQDICNEFLELETNN